MNDFPIDGSDQQLAWELQEIERVATELHEHGISDVEVDSTRTKMEQPATMQVDQPRFSLTRNLHQGWDITWHHRPSTSETV